MPLLRKLDLDEELWILGRQELWPQILACVYENTTHVVTYDQVTYVVLRLKDGSEVGWNTRKKRPHFVWYAQIGERSINYVPPPRPSAVPFDCTNPEQLCLYGDSMVFSPRQLSTKESLIMVVEQTTITGFNVFPNVKEQAIYFGVLTGVTHDPTLLRREQIEHSGTYDLITGKRANATLNDYGQLIKLEVLAACD